MSKQEQIANLTQHKATPEQIAAGVIDMEEVWRTRVIALLTFEEIPDASELRNAAENIANLCTEQFPNCITAMIGGAPYFMSALEQALIAQGIKPVYAFSKRESAEEVQLDGSVRKTMLFRHLGFVEVAI